MHMKYREEADYRQAMDELCFSQVAKARMTRNLRQSLARQAEPGPVVMGIRPEHLAIGETGMAASADVCEMTGGSVNVHAFVGEREVTASVPSHSSTASDLPAPGGVIHLAPEPEMIHIFDKDTGESLLRE